MKDLTCTVVENREAAEGIFELTLALPEEADIRAGQFALLSVGGGHALRRPIAVCRHGNGLAVFCYQVRGKGTKRLSELARGGKINVLLPLGNGFYLEESEKEVALVGGGVGIFPMISVLNEYEKRKRIAAYIGFRNAAAVCGTEEFSKADRFTLVTDDGSAGEKMNAVEALKRDLEKGYRPDVVLSCGPTPMLRALKPVLEGYGIKGYVSLEERMGCGIGACLVCVCNLTNGEHARVCKDGPVFDIGEVVL